MLLRALIAGVIAVTAASPAFAADPRRDEQWGLEMVKGPDAWETSTGVGAVVAVIDTGVQPDHPDLGDRLLEGFDFVANDRNPADGDGHGTHVTGIVAANRDNGEGIAGVAPGARVLPLRVLDNAGEGDTADVIEAIDRAIDQHVHVINLSLGDLLPLDSTLFEDPEYKEVLERAVAAGIVVVIAAGNNRLPMCEGPEVDGAVCVGGVDPRGMRGLAYSSYGSNVDLMAPGGSCVGGSSEDVLSTFIPSRYRSFCGTSQAAPHVAGVAALLVSLGLSGQAAADRIVATAAEAGSPSEGWDNIVDAAAAVEGLAPPSPPDPGDPDPARGSFSVKSPVKPRAVRRRGFRVTCVAARPGTCTVVVRRLGRKIAAGRNDVPADIATAVSARLNRAGRKVLKRMGRRMGVLAKVTLPGEPTRTRRIVIRR